MKRRSFIKLTGGALATASILLKAAEAKPVIKKESKSKEKQICFEYTVKSYRNHTLILDREERLTPKLVMINTQNGTTCILGKRFWLGIFDVTSVGGHTFNAKPGDVLLTWWSFYE